MKQHFLVIDFKGVSEDIQTECLRYAGIKLDDYLFETDDGKAYRPPSGMLIQPWMEMNIARMYTFGVKAKRVFCEQGKRLDKLNPVDMLNFMTIMVPAATAYVDLISIL